MYRKFYRPKIDPYDRSYHKDTELEEAAELEELEKIVFAAEPPESFVVRKDQQDIGAGTLGLAYMNSREVNVLNSLDYKGFLIVLHHERKHLRKPYLSEYEVRREVKNELPSDHVGVYGL